MLLRSLTLAIVTTAALAAGGTLAGAAAQANPSHPATCAKVTEAGYRMSSSNAVVMNLSGTTPISRWSMCAHGITGTAEMTISPFEQLLAINNLSFDLPVHNLKGDHEAMDDHAYTALKADHYKDIVFRLASATIAANSQGYLVNGTGMLTVAGVSRQVTLLMHSQINPDGSITFTGSQNLRMSDYNVERPSLLFGAIRASDDMTLTFTLIFTKQPS